MKELAKALRGWQSEYGKSLGSVLYSDIGRSTMLSWDGRQTLATFICLFRL